MTFTRAFTWTFLIVLVLAAAFGAGYLTRARFSSLESYPVLNQAYRILRDNGLRDLPADPALEYGMIRGMLQAYNDPYTIFVEPAQAELESNALQGSFGGIGVGLANDEEGNWVLFPFPDSPAQEAGIQEGDRLIKVGNLEIGPDTLVDTIQSAIRGPVGERVRLTLARPPDVTTFEVDVKRAEIPLPSVVWHLDPDEPRLGVLQVNLIAASTTEELEKAVKDLQERGAQAFVLDLRNNPGGLLDAGVNVARLFLEDGIIIEQQYRGQDVKSFRVDRPGPLTDIELAVLINHGSASAAEIVAGSLKAHERALVVGTPSFGKNTIQLVFELEDKSSLHVTAAEWWVPGIEPPLSEGGLQPDILVDPSDNNTSGPDPVLRAAREALLSETATP